MKNEIEIYKDKNNQTQVEVRFEEETVWLTQKQMSILFGKNSDTIGLHLKNIYSEKELSKKATTELFSVVQTEGKRKVSRSELANRKTKFTFYQALMKRLKKVAKQIEKRQEFKKGILKQMFV